MPELRESIRRDVLFREDAPLTLRLAQPFGAGLPASSATNQEFESNPNYETSPQGPTMKPWPTHVEMHAGQPDINTDYNAD
jgi:hypothetical protein